ncbi:MAG: hypothetical protein AAF721_09125 [Myxococcota bacterium]
MRESCVGRNSPAPFHHDFADEHPRSPRRWAIYGERPWLGFDGTGFDPVRRAYDLDTGETLDVPGVPVGFLPKHVIGGTVAYAGPDHDTMTVGPRVP